MQRQKQPMPPQRFRRLNVLTERSPPSFNKHIHKPANPGHAVARQRHAAMSGQVSTKTREGWGGGGCSCLWLSLSGSSSRPPPLCLCFCPNQAVSCDTQQTVCHDSESTSILLPVSLPPQKRHQTLCSAAQVLHASFRSSRPLLCALCPSCFCLMPIRTPL